MITFQHILCISSNQTPLIPNSSASPKCSVYTSGFKILKIIPFSNLEFIFDSTVLSFFFFFNHNVGEGNGNPLQYSCLENPMDGGAWWALVHGVAKSRARLSDFTFTFQFHALEKEMATHSSVLAWRIPGMGEPGGLPSMGSHRVQHDWSDLAAAAAVWHQILLGILWDYFHFLISAALYS